eukprot:scaffold511910_cov83-Attheya_sp.AAC.1
MPISIADVVPQLLESACRLFLLGTHTQIVTPACQYSGYEPATPHNQAADPYAYRTHYRRAFFAGWRAAL